VGGIKGSRRKDAKDKKTAKDTYWMPAISNLRTLGRWVLADLTEICQIDVGSKANVESTVNKMIERIGGTPAAVSA
jgi:hypothetical protein